MDAREMLEQARTIAVVGASDQRARPAGFVPAEMQAAGYRIIPVNPTLDEVLGEPAYDSLHDVPEPVDIVNVFRRGPEVPGVVRDAIAIGAKAIWVQLGIRSDEGRALAAEAGVPYIENACISVERKRTGALPRAS